MVNSITNYIKPNNQKWNRCKDYARIMGGTRSRKNKLNVKRGVGNHRIRTEQQKG